MARNAGISLESDDIETVPGGYEIDGMDPKEWVEAMTEDTEDESPAGEVCQYSAAHIWREIPATTTLEHPILGTLPVCAECADFYKRMK